MADHLVEIVRKDLPNLRKLFLPDEPKTHLGLFTIENYIRWFQQDQNLRNIAFYSLNGEWSDGTFVVVDRYHVFVDSLNESNDVLLRLLQLLDYSNGFKFMHIRSRHHPVILEIIKRKKLHLEYDDPTLLYYLPKEKALNLETVVPEKFHVRSLNASDVAIANAGWPFNHPGSLYYLQRLARLNPSGGAFTADGKLVAWLFQFQSGPLGALQTNKDYSNRGLGTAVVKFVLKQIAELGLSGCACVNEQNLASRAIFEKLGCEIIDRVHWMATPCEWTEEE